jgi:hypothetical protein
MRVIAIGGLGVYGVANLLAGIVDIALEGRLARHVEALLVFVGVVLLIGAILVARESSRAWMGALTGLVLASGLALYNERVLGLGHPSHHLIRGAYTLVVLIAVWKCTRQTGVPTDAA